VSPTYDLLGWISCDLLNGAWVIQSMPRHIKVANSGYLAEDNVWSKL